MRFIKTFNVLFFLFTLSYTTTKNFAQNTDSIIVLNDETEILNIGKQVYFLEDKEGKLTIEDIQKPEYQRQFKKSEKDLLFFGTTDSKIWFKFQFKNQTKQNVLLEIAESTLWYVDFYKPDPNGNPKLTTQIGMMQPINNREINTNFYLFELTNQPDTLTYYFSVKSDYPFAIPLSIITKNQQIEQTYQNTLFFGIFIGFCLIMFIYNLLIYLSIWDKNYLYYCLYIINTGFAIALVSGNYGHHLNYNTYLFQYFILTPSLVIMLTVSIFIITFLEIKKTSWFYKIVIFCNSLSAVLGIVSTIDQHYVQLIDVYQGIFMILYMSIIVVAIQKMKQGHQSAQFIIFGFSFYMLSAFMYMFQNLGLISSNFWTKNILVFGTSIEMMLFAFALSYKIKVTQRDKQTAQLALLRKSRENEKLVLEQNTVLEQKVHERTEELQVLNEELNSTVEELGLTLETLDTQKKIVESTNRKITASINYAQTIQQAVLPDKLILESYLQDYFLLYRPKDIVSGDFYWAAPIRRGYVVAVADCTGHGVAGSFMSLVGINLLGKMEDELETLSPAEMIRKLNIGVDKALKQDERQSYNEGMDIGIVRVEKEGNNYTLTFAGAKRPLYYISKEERKLQEIAGDRYSVGIGTQREIFIQNHTLTLKTGDSFYLLSDGLADQNNEKRKRLGENILKETLQNLFDQESNTQLQQLEKLLDEHQGTAEQRDDITLLSVKLI